LRKRLGGQFNYQFSTPFANSTVDLAYANSTVDLAYANSTVDLAFGRSGSNIVSTSPDRARFLGLILLLALPLLILTAGAGGGAGPFAGLTGSARVLAGVFHLVDAPANDYEFEIQKLRLFRALVAAGVGGSLALAGAMAQGLFRNPMAEPGLLGIGSGAALGAILGIAVMGGYGPATSMLDVPVSLGFVPLMSLFGAAAVALTVYRLSTRGGRLSVSLLLLTGLAINAIAGSLMAMLQVFLLDDYKIAQAIMSWGFGTFDDRTELQIGVIWSGAAVALAAIPFVGLELDLLAGGEIDAAGLGADPVRVKTIVLGCIALATAAAVAFCGQIAFVGLLVPHIVRTICGPKHRALLPVSFLTGAVMLVLIVVFQHNLCPHLAAGLSASGHIGSARIVDRVAGLQPGVLTSLLGSPFFLVLLLRQGRSLE
jgi:iron complex transport system permease protein